LNWLLYCTIRPVGPWTRGRGPGVADVRNGDSSGSPGRTIAQSTTILHSVIRRR
jgi:hypothetical protein